MHIKIHGEDFVLADRRIIILVNDCFWHGHEGCPHEGLHPSVSGKWMRRKKRIQRMNRRLWARLTTRGWTVIIIWKCEVTELKQSYSSMNLFRDYLTILHKEITRLKLIHAR